jgi:UDP-N-acetylglucosamine 1-carboxyvinyltransferase
MDKFVIKGNKPLAGRVTVEGSKNAALPIIAATLMIEKGETVLHNIPPLRDINTLIAMLNHVGARVSFNSNERIMTINAAQLTNNNAPYDLMRQMRASFLVLGPILQRFGEAVVSLPGGCSLGPRPVNYHIKGFKALGAEIAESKGYITAKAARLRGNTVFFDRPSHTGTENIMYGAVLAKGKTTIINAACDPEVVDLANYLNQAGAKISGAGTPTIVVEGVSSLKAIEYNVMGDRLEAGTYLFSAIATGGEIEVSGTETSHLEMVLNKMKEMGAEIKQSATGIKLKAPSKIKPVEAVTYPFPGFPTDLLACLMAATAKATGISRIKETVFEDRFSQVMELRRMGADITVNAMEATINGVKRLDGASVMASDIRAGAGLVIAGLSASGKTEVLRIYHVDRGYCQLEEKLCLLGADIKRIAA